MGGRPGICTTVDPISSGAPGRPGSSGAPGGGGGGAGGMPLLINRVTMMPGMVWPLGEVPTTVPADAVLLIELA